MGLCRLRTAIVHSKASTAANLALTIPVQWNGAPSALRRASAKIEGLETWWQIIEAAPLKMVVDSAEKPVRWGANHKGDDAYEA